MTPETRAALYAAFAQDDLEHLQEWLAGSHKVSGPLEQLDWDDIERLENNSMLHGTIALKYVLPRWLELFSEDETPPYWADKATLAHILKEDWRRSRWWPDQIEAVRCVFDEWREESLRSGLMDDFAEFIGGLEEDVARYLDPWLRARPIEVAAWLWKTSFVRPNALRTWAILPRVENKLEETFFRNPDGEHAELLSDVIQLLRSLRALESNSNSS